MQCNASVLKIVLKPTRQPRYRVQDGSCPNHKNSLFDPRFHLKLKFHSVRLRKIPLSERPLI